MQITLSFVSIRVVDNARNEVRNEEGCGAINPCRSGIACCCGHSRGAADEKSPRIGFLVPFTASSESARKDAFLQGLRDLGYVEGKTLRMSTDTDS
jgi:hypothetical protein